MFELKSNWVWGFKKRGWLRISSIDVGVGKSILVKCSQALSSWITKSLLYFCKFLCVKGRRIWSYVIRQLVKQLVHTMLIANNYDSFHLWWKENLVKNQNVSKYYNPDCRRMKRFLSLKYKLLFCVSLFFVLFLSFSSAEFKRQLLGNLLSTGLGRSMHLYALICISH